MSTTPRHTKTIISKYHPEGEQSHCQCGIGEDHIVDLLKPKSNAISKAMQLIRSKEGKE